MLDKKFYLVVLLFLMIYAGGWLAVPGRQHIEFSSTGLNSHFTIQKNDTFAQYVATTRQKVKAARLKAHRDISEHTMDENSPIALLPSNACPKSVNGKYENGILLIHGFLDSTYSMQQLGHYFQNKCYVTYVILLPGHGTTAGDLLHVRYQDWVKATHFGANKLAEQVNHVYIGGFSLGGLLAMNEALDEPTAIRGLILFAPALKLASPYAPLLKPVYHSSQVLPLLRWWELYPESTQVRYESVAINPVFQIEKLMKKVSHKLKSHMLTIPLFIEQSAEDNAVDPTLNLDLMLKDTNPKSRMLWYSEKNLKPSNDNRIETLNSRLMNQHIVSFAHTSLILPASDPIFGLYGEYKSCVQYAAGSPHWQQCESMDNIDFGEITEKHLKQYVIRRLTFNPLYDHAMQSLDTFLLATQQ